jgi:hypothetical protein
MNASELALSMMTLLKRGIAVASQNLSGGIIARVKRRNNWISIVLKMKKRDWHRTSAPVTPCAQIKFKPQRRSQ